MGELNTTERTWDEVRQQVKERADLVEIIGRHTKLTKSGHSFRGCCPFHKEKTPSFYVHPNEGFFHCFGCDAGGDVFTFVMKTEGLTFPEALRDLAGSLGLELPRSPRSREAAAADEGRKSRLEAGYKLLDRAGKFYHQVLMRGATDGAKRAYAYLRQRGIDDEEIAALGLGWAPENGEELLRRLTTADDRALALGTGLMREGRSVYEFFRSRLLIPIRDAKARPVAFSGRTLDPVGEGNPKYKNSSETEWFHKKEVLYGLDRAGALIRSEGFVCLVEGYFDQWAFHRRGIPAVAVMGTALSDEQIRLLGRYTKRVILVLDTDRAGTESTLKAIPPFLMAGWSVSVFSDLAGKDPDEWLSSQPDADVTKKLQSATEAIEWWISLLLKDALATGIGRAEAYRRVVEPWKYAPTKIHKRVLADRIGLLLNLSGDQVLQDLEDGGAQRIAREEEPPPPVPVASKPTQTIGSQSSYADENVILSKSLEEEFFINMAQYWEQVKTLGPEAREAWIAIFSGRAPEATLRSFWEAAGPDAPWPKDWTERLEAFPQIVAWIRKGLVLRDSSTQDTDKEQILKSFTEITYRLRLKVLQRERSQLQSSLWGKDPNSKDVAEILQRIQAVKRLEIELEKSR